MKLGNSSGAKAGQEGGYEKIMSKELQPALVFEKTKQVGEIRSRWLWVEPSIWTDRMLTALDEGVKVGKNAYFEEHGLISMQVLAKRRSS